MPARLVIVTERPSSEPAPQTATAETLAAGGRACGLTVDVVQRQLPAHGSDASAQPELPMADAYLHVGLTALAADTVMAARRHQRPVIVHALGDELETSFTDWQSAPWVRMTIAHATRLSAGSARAQRLLTPFHAHDVRLLPTPAMLAAAAPVAGRRPLRHGLGLPPEGLLIGVFDPPATEIITLLLTTFSEVWDSRQDAWLLLAGQRLSAATVAAVEHWARQDHQPARRVILRQPEPGQSTLDLIPACDQVWSLSADHGPSPAVQMALRAAVPVVASTTSGQDPLSGERVQDSAPASHGRDDRPPSWTVPQAIDSLVFAALSHAADPALARQRSLDALAALPGGYRQEGLEANLRACFADLGLLGG